MSGLHRPQSLPVDPRPDGGQAPLTLATTSRPKAQTSKGDLSFLKKSRARHASDSSKFRWLTEWLTGRTSPTAPTPYFHCNHALGMSRNHANPFASGAKGRRFESCSGRFCHVARHSSLFLLNQLRASFSRPTVWPCLGGLRSCSGSATDPQKATGGPVAVRLLTGIMSVHATKGAT